MWKGEKKNKIINKIHTHQLKKPKKIKHKIIHPVIWLLQFPSSGRSVSNSGPSPSPSPSPSPHQCNEFRRYQRGVGDVHQRGEATHSRRAPKRCFHPEERTPTRPVSSFIHWFIHSLIHSFSVERTFVWVIAVVLNVSPSSCLFQQLRAIAPRK